MAFLTSILISLLASLAGVKADMTLWRTSTCTETAWSTQLMAASTVWNTVTYTETAWSTYIPPAVTVSIPYTVTSVLEKSYTDTLSIPYTVKSVIESDHTDTMTSTMELAYTDTVTSTVEHNYTTTITETSVSVNVVASLTTKYSEFTTTLTSVVVSITTFLQSGPTITKACTPITINQPTTITINQPTTVSLPHNTLTAYTTSSLTSIVLCPSRTLNPTYTNSTPIPDEYTWGCPPGTVCKPPQVGCNFEQNPPADTYYCSPNECLPVPPLPSFTPTPIGGGICGPYPNTPDYFNFNPELFGLSYSIFVEGGNYAENCAGCSMAMVMPVTQISDGQPQAPTLVSICETTVAPVTTIFDGQPQGPITTAARFARRQPPPQALPQVCYEHCDMCLGIAIHDGKIACCPHDSKFSAAYLQCQACLVGHATDTRTNAAAVLPSLNPYVSYCAAHKNAAPAESTTPTHSTTTIVFTSQASTTQQPSRTTTQATTTRTSITTTSKTSIQSASSPSKPSTLTTSSPTRSSLSSLSPTRSSAGSSTLPPVQTSTPVATAPSIEPTSSTRQPLSGTSTVCAVSEISDGQPQACASTVSAVSQISDGQPQAPTSAIATFTGAAGHAVSFPSLSWSSPMGWALLLFVNALPL